MQKVRVIAGSLRGRQVIFPDQADLRPTLARIRETMFAWLEPYLYQANCLDLFAGSGAMGFEAISRGAKHVVMLDKNPKACAAILENQARFCVENIAVIQADFSKSFAKLQAFDKFNVVFLDPPFTGKLLELALTLLVEHDLLAPGAVCICEWGLQNPPNFPTMYTTKKLKKTGRVGYGLLVYENSGEKL